MTARTYTKTDRHMKGVVWQGNPPRPFVTAEGMPPCQKKPRHPHVEWLGSECLGCAGDREFTRASAISPENPAAAMRPYWEWVKP
jgi:hypothetical protein